MSNRNAFVIALVAGCFGTVLSGCAVDPADEVEDLDSNQATAATDQTPTTRNQAPDETGRIASGRVREPAELDMGPGELYNEEEWGEPEGADHVAATKGVTVSNEAQLNLLETLDLGNDTLVRFYEPEAGELVVIETGRIASGRVRERAELDMGPGELYKVLSGREAPASLIAADLRRAVVRSRAAQSRDDAPANRPSEPSQEPAQAGAREKGGGNNLGEASFRDTYCNYTAKHTANWVWVTGYGATGTWNDIHKFNSAATALQGAIRHRAYRRNWFDWDTLTNVTVNQGWYSTVSVNTVGSGDFDGKAVFDESDGDTYHGCSQGA